MCTKFYQNRWGFVEETTKTFWCVFSVHSVDSKLLSLFLYYSHCQTVTDAVLTHSSAVSIICYFLGSSVFVGWWFRYCRPNLGSTSKS